MRAVVIGSGIGGSAATLLLQHAGLQTTLLEKNLRLGGSCASYTKRGFKIDIGTHLFCRGPKGPLGEVLRRVGRPDAIRFVRTRDIAEIRTSARDRRDRIRIRVPADRIRYPRFFLDLMIGMRLPPREVFRAGRLFADLLTMPEWEVARWDDRTVEDLIRPYTDNPATLALFGFLLGLFFVLPYWEVSAGEAIWSFKRLVRDNWLSYPLGGTSEIPETYCRLARARGAEIRTGLGVRRILVQDRRVRGVELEDGSVVEAEVVVSTSSVRTTVLRLVGEEHFPEAYVARARAIRASYIATQAKIALDKKLVHAGALVGGFGERSGLFDLKATELKEIFSSVLEGRVPPVVPFYCPVPSNFDPSLAPPGCQLLTLCSVAPTSDIALKDPGPRWEEAMMQSIRAVIPDFDRHVMFVDRLSVGFIEHWIGKDFGPAISTGQVPGQVGVRRPRVATPLRGLYLAGCGAGARGVGTELAAASAMECVDQVAADLPELIALARIGRRLEAEAS